MAGEPKEIIERIVDELIVERLKPLIIKIEELEKNFKQHDETLLEIARITALLKVNSDMTDLLLIIRQLRNKENMQTQALVDATRVKEKILTSNNPVHLAAEFHRSWDKILHDLGIDYISY